jgi:hypothetical protein
MRGRGPLAEDIRRLFEVGLKRCGLNRRRYDLSTEHFRRVQRGQLELFE